MKSREAGYSLVELLMAILILGIATLPIITASRMSRRRIARTEHEMVAVHLARWQADRIACAPGPGNRVKDMEEDVDLSGSVYRVETRVLDGDKPDEPPEGTCPLQVVIVVRHRDREMGRRYLEVLK